MKAIVYTSNTGHTAQYAKMLGVKTGLPVYSLNEAAKSLPKGTSIIYPGWIFANSVKGYKKASETFTVSAVCAVGLCDTGALIDEVRKANSLPDPMPLFTMQGGIDKTRLRGIHKLMIQVLTKGLAWRKERSGNDARMLEQLTHDRNDVRQRNTKSFMEWYNSMGAKDEK